MNKPLQVVKPESLAIVYDSHSDCQAIYVEGKLRGEYEELTPKELFECYGCYAKTGVVTMAFHEINSETLSIWNDTWGQPDWPNNINELGIKEV